tara:strand:+ start:1482 stop:2939 length:1458 start_codon:yes stop_codon:yes gene_type:complete
VNQEKDKNSLINWEIVSVNPNDKNWDWKDLFCFWGNNVQSIMAFSLIASLYLVYDLNFFIVFFGSLIGSLLVFLFANLIGKPSQKHGIPFPVLLRTSLGIKGAKYFALLRGLVGIFMFGIQTYFLSKAFTYLIRIFLFTFDKSILDNDIFTIFFLGLNIIDISSFLIAILVQAYLFSKNFKFKRKIINTSALTVYLGMIIFFLSVLLTDLQLVTEAFLEIFKSENFFQKNNLIPLITVAGTIFAYFSIILVNYGDFSRYVKNENELKKGNLSLFLNLIIFSFFTVFIVVGSNVLINNDIQNINKILTNPTDIVGTFNNTKITIIALFFILFASASTNLIANYIPAQNSLLNFLPTKLNLKNTCIIISFFGFIIGFLWLTLLSQIGILSLIDTAGAFFGPLFGIMVADYYLINKTNLNNKDIFSSEKTGSYYFSKGWHIRGVYCLLLGFIFASSTIWNSNLMFLHSFSWIIGAFISSLSYYLLSTR